MGRLDRVRRLLSGRSGDAAMLAQLDGRFEAAAARLEAHTVNLAEHQAQLRDESLRQIVNEMRANSAFLADSTIALERLHARRFDFTHAAVRPIVHAVRAALAPSSTAVLVDHADAVLVDELVTDGLAVMVVEPAIDHPFPSSVVVSTVAITDFRGPTSPVQLVVWVARERPPSAKLAHVRRWMAAGGACIVACPEPLTAVAGFECADRRAFARTDDGRFARHDGPDSSRSPSLHVHHLVAT